MIFSWPFASLEINKDQFIINEKNTFAFLENDVSNYSSSDGIVEFENVKLIFISFQLIVIGTT